MTSDQTITIKIKADEFIARIERLQIHTLYFALVCYRFQHGWRRFFMRDSWRSLFRWWFPTTGTHRGQNFQGLEKP